MRIQTWLLVHNSKIEIINNMKFMLRGELVINISLISKGVQQFETIVDANRDQCRIILQIGDHLNTWWMASGLRRQWISSSDCPLLEAIKGEQRDDWRAATAVLTQTEDRKRNVLVSALDSSAASASLRFLSSSCAVHSSRPGAFLDLGLLGFSG
jgi:hypothetical protein